MFSLLKFPLPPLAFRVPPSSWWAGGALLAAWLGLWDKLRIDWSVNDQYSYGWFVPPLALVLLWSRWRDRPPAGGELASDECRVASGGFPWIAAACLALLLPVRLLEEPNGDWRLIFWVHAALLVGLSLALAAWRGGWAWVRHFTFPALFLLVALRWPSGPEQALVQGLMRGVAAISTELMNLLGIPAVQAGNLIRARGQLVGISEACSGIRSLQAVVMGALFFGEFTRLSWPRRGILLAGGIGLAMAANVFRSSLLVWIAANYGSAQLERYHDTAGRSVVIVVFVGLLALNTWLERPARPPAAPRPDDPAAPSPPASATPPPVALLPAARTVPVGFALGALAWLAVCEAGTAAWYRAHEHGRVPLPAWEVAMPTDAPGFKKLEVDDVSRALLRYDTESTARWRCEGGPRPAVCTLYFFRWEPGRTSATLAAMHQPTACLPSAGLVQAADGGVRPCPTRSGITLPVHEYEFTLREQRLYVYYVVWQDRSGDAMSGEVGGRLERLRAAWRGERNLGQQSLECVITGPASAAEARGVFERQMNEVVRRKG